MPVAIPTWRKVLLMPEAGAAEPGSATTLDRRVAERRVHEADARPGDEEPGQQRRPLRGGRDAAHQKQPGADGRRARPKISTRTGTRFVSRAAIGAAKKDSTDTGRKRRPAWNGEYLSTFCM